MPYKCSEKKRQRTREDQKRRREIVKRIIREAKAKPCADCGVGYPWYVMDFDHGINEKVYAIAKAVQRPTNTTIAELPDEIAKCDVVCANCHRERHAVDVFMADVM